MQIRRMLRWPLAPFGWCYGGIMRFRNWLYDKEVLSSSEHPIAVVCVGNITVGGTGKTPLVDFILSHKSDIFGELSLAVVSRGYGRKTHEQVVATGDATAETIGDEAMMLHSRHPDTVFILDGDRNAAIETAVSMDHEAVLMDDGMQHRSTMARLYIAVCDYSRPMWDDMMLPAGDLREPWRGVGRAAVAVVSKCPDDLKKEQAEKIEDRLKTAGVQHVFFTTIDYGMLVSPRGCEVECASCCPVVAVAGVGRPKPFYDQLRRMFDDVHEMTFPDHHAFSEADFRKIEKKLTELGDDAICVCTEKDQARLSGRLPRNVQQKMFTLPIRTKFLFGQQEQFIQTVKSLACT